MPAAPPPKPSSPRAKGARAKSGCYTCRIRRKKCDEQPNPDGSCQTCTRLRLECLGFGHKRPEWLRENRNAVELRDKIKTFLAAQGMIKGHSGAGPRSLEQEPAILRLTDAFQDSASNHGPRDSSSESSNPSVVQTTSFSGEEGWHENVPIPLGLQLLRGPSQISSSARYSPPGRNDITSPNGIDALTVTKRSPFWIYNPPEEFYDGYEIGDEDIRPHDPFKHDPFYVPLSAPLPQFPVDDFISHYYMENILAMQYLLGDRRSITSIIYQSAIKSLESRESVTLLSQVHMNRWYFPARVAIDTELGIRLNNLQRTLSAGNLSPDDALAALHVVSVYLFDGGRGAWEEFLQLTQLYVSTVLCRFNSPRYALMNCSPTDAFIVKTAIWFDVLASITTMKPPHFYRAIQDLFHPSLSGIHCPDEALSDQCSMMNPMGCQNDVVWALSETSFLSHWKQENLRKGCLSVPELVSKAKEIEPYILQSTDPQLKGDESSLGRYYAAEIFRSSTLLFLRTVVSGDYPDVPEISHGVDETIRCIKEVLLQPLSAVSYAVVRNTVFSHYICGSLTRKVEDQNVILRSLSEKANNTTAIGNCASVRQILEEIWRTPVAANSPVNWRERLSESPGSSILLV